MQGSRTTVAKMKDLDIEKMKELGIEVKHIEVPGGSHGGVVAPSVSFSYCCPAVLLLAEGTSTTVV